MANADDLIVSIRRRLHGLEEEVKRLGSALGRHEGRIGTLMEQAEKSQEATDQLEARIADHETRHRADACSQ